MKKLAAIMLVFALTLCSCGESDNSEETVVPNGETPVNNSEKEDIPVENINATPRITAMGIRGAVVADAVVTDEKYSADSTGTDDVTAVFNRAINDVAASGGGTVFIPAGSYRLTSTVDVLSFVSLVGEEGTLIIADVESVDANFPALFELGGSAGVCSLTVYYPGQTTSDIKPYPFTFSIPGSAKAPDYYMLSSIEDCTVINGYRGVYAGSVNEQMNIDGVYGCFLYRALELYDSADASVIKNVHTSSEYWDASHGGEDQNAIKSYTKENGCAFMFGDIEWGQFEGLYADSYQYGMQIVHGPRAKFSGMLYDVSLLDCRFGLLVSEIDERGGYGMSITKGKIEGEEYAARNDTVGKVQFTDVELTGEIANGKKKITVDKTLPSSYPAPAEKCKYVTSSDSLVVITDADNKAGSDASDVIQNALDSLSQSGGIVYIPAGYYKIDKPITVPDGVELRGSGYLPVRDQMTKSAGTILFCYYGRDLASPEDAQALVTLGEGSGISCLRFVNADCDLLSYYMQNNELPAYPFIIRGIGDGSYVSGSSIAGAVYGIEMLNNKNGYVDNLSSNFYRAGIRFNGCTGGYVGNVLTNVTVGFRNDWRGFDNYSSLFPNGFEKNFEVSLADEDDYNTVNMAMDNLTQIDCINSSGLLVENVFSYGAGTTIALSGSTLDGINVGRDCNWLYVIKYFMLIAENNSALRIYGQHRFNGRSFDRDDSSSVELYSRVTIGSDERNKVW